MNSFPFSICYFSFFIGDLSSGKMTNNKWRMENGKSKQKMKDPSRSAAFDNKGEQ